MRVVVQRVSEASVSVDGESVAGIGTGLVALVGFRPGDGGAEIDWMANRLLGLRVFPDEAGRMNRSVSDVGGEVLIVSQFTLYGDASRGRRPSFVGAEDADRAAGLYDQFMARCRAGSVPVVGGRFGANMAVALVNQGPVTLVIDR